MAVFAPSGRGPVSRRGKRPNHVVVRDGSAGTGRELTPIGMEPAKMAVVALYRSAEIYLFDFDPCRSHDLTPFGDVGLHALGEHLRRAAGRNSALREQPLLDVLRRKRFLRFGVELQNNFP